MTHLCDRELRFLVTPGEAEAVLAAADGALEPEIHDRRRPIAYARTTYLDTGDLAYLRTWNGPVASRLRVRQYAAAKSLADEPVATASAYLELKESAGEERRKVRISAPPESLAQLLRGDLQDDWLRRRLSRVPELRDAEWGLAVGVLRPRLTTFYRRLSFDGDGVRVTLDEGLRFCAPVHPVAEDRSATPEPCLAHGPAAILEVKLQGRTPPWLSAATCRLCPMPHFSKYRAGMRALARLRGGAARRIALSPPAFDGAMGGRIARA